MNTTGIIVISTFIVVVFIGVLLGRKRQRKEWNNGLCPKCGKELEHFADDSQGGNGWCCCDCDYYIWITYKRYVYKRWKITNRN